MAESESGEVKLPSETGLAQLPRWARVAFAARCARRVQPLYMHSWSDATQKQLDAIDRAITLAQSSAERSDSASEDDLNDAHAALNYAHVALYDAHAADDDAQVPSAAILATLDAVRAAARAALATLDHTDVAYAAGRAALVAATYAARAGRVTADAICEDYELLKREREHWTDETPVPPKFFGPLWPDGAPDGWPMATL